MMHKRARLLLATMLTASLSSFAAAQESQLHRDFLNPPQEAKARVWWHWANGNVTLDGIQKDLAWMNRVGIGGAHYFDAGGRFMQFKFIEPRLVVGDANWRAAVKTAAETADRYGMELTTAASPGWSVTGGPWVKPEQAMKKYVWSETVVDGGRQVRTALPAPPGKTGPFQGIALAGANEEYYRDALVFAYRMPRVERDLVPTSVIGESGPLDAAKLRDGDFGATQTITGKGVDQPTWIMAQFDRPVTVRGLELGIAGKGASEGPIKPVLEISDDGKQWRAGATLTGPAVAAVKSYGFTPLTARYFRLSLPAEPPGVQLPGMSQPRRPGPTKVAISEFVLRSNGTVDRFAEKAGFGEPMDYTEAPTAAAAADAVVRRSDVLDLTGKMAADGALDWRAPAGRWRIVRLGYSLTGAKNHPAPPEATGLEVDKFSERHVRAYIQEYLSRFESALGKDLIGKRGLQNLLVDSWESGVQNWTDDMPAEFRKRRGYDMLPWLPVLTGQVVESAEASDRFLWDFRRTLQDLLAQHYAVLRDEVAKRGMGLYTEAQGDLWRAIGDGMEIKSRADIPMAEYWYRYWTAGPGQPALKADMRESASVAHIYGKRFVANESLTVFSMNDPWSFSPAMLKPVVDEIFAQGINRFVVHTSTHQPLDKKPGVTTGPFGQYINRNETWAEQAGPFFSYIARTSYLLQQGRYVADVAYFYGEELPLVEQFEGQNDAAADRLKTEVPEGYGYDFINGEALRNETLVRDGQLATRAGMRYRLLFMPKRVTAMTVPTLRKLVALVESGATLVGDPPREALGLSSTQAEFAQLANRLWGGQAGALGVRRVGMGKVYSSTSLADALKAEQVAPDVVVSGAGTNVVQLHRRLDDGTDIYFLANRFAKPANVSASFRAVGREPRLWHSDSGLSEAVSYRIAGARTDVPLSLDPNEAVFVVFDKPAQSQAATVAPKMRRPVGELAGPWSVAFPPNLGAPASTTLPGLVSWTESSDQGVKYFSGTATYSRTMNVDPRWVGEGRRLLLDLGQVHELAEVVINGRSAGIAWKPPFAVDITDLVKPGANRLEIKVTNLWPNRIIGDAKTGQKITWTPPGAMGGYNANGRLLPSGLLGPARLLVEETARAPTASLVAN